MNGTHHHNHADAHHVHFDTPEMAGMAETEGEVLLGLMTDAASRLAGLCARHGVEVGRVLDIGCGPGVGTCCLAGQFDTATVVAVDGAALMLERATARAERLGFGPRVETRLVELPGGLATLGHADVAWVSMALHHVGDEEAALGGIRGVLAPGGLLALVEGAGPMRFVPDDVDLGRPGIWERLDTAWAAWFAGMRAGLPDATPSADYPSMLAAAGFDLLEDEVLTLVLDAPLDERARRFAHARLAGTPAQLAGHADEADLRALDVLTDERSDGGIMRRGDAIIRATRHLFVARA
jgi:SAM-dependent methyltransferase